MDIEAYAAKTRDRDDLTKMGLARLLQMRDGFSAERRNSIWSALHKPELIAALEDPGAGRVVGKTKAKAVAKRRK